MVKVKCIKCSREGSLTKKQTKSKGITYEYWYIEHHIGDKIKWCYLGKYEKLPEEYKKLIHKDTQNSDSLKKPNSSLDLKTWNTKFVNACWGRGPVWSKIRAWGVRGPGFKSPRPHQAYFAK